ncbi:response regulator transcription factor [Microbacterium sp. ASV49]|uniref:Response regulator transcription factor n=1 Tax=Microbacterium candidum TaxID=3041922 RepID=A0ABT7MZR3_9MICO|nr:response regulator transcription factor [Microbacterium sp. ASV49]MDL9979922.1 response regulator transcription factor [Microbacterium sp. ASV49]
MDGARVAVVVEDDEDIRSLLSAVLEQAGFAVHSTGTAVEAIDLVRTHDPVVTTLDVGLPGMDGFEAARRIRRISPTYIVMLTARTEEIDALQGLESGADDYITKPFRPRELRARIDAMLRRPRVQPDATSATPAAPEWIEHDGLRVNPGMRLVVADGQDVDLTRSEFDILVELLGAGGRVVSKSRLALLVRGEDDPTAYVGDNDARAIEVHVANLRRKLGDAPSAPRWVETVRGVGYRTSAG